MARRADAVTTDQHAPDEFADLAELMAHEEEFGPRRDPADLAARRRRRRKALLVVAIVLAAILAVAGAYTGWALTTPLPAPVAASYEPRVVVPGPAEIVLPAEGAAVVSVAGADEYLGATAGDALATSGSNDPRPIASITKLITALVVLDAHPLADANDPGPTIVFDKADHDLYDKYYVMGATIAAMPTGSSMSQRDALATMLIPSASNYAEAVSAWAFGSQWGFLGAAREWLAAHGLTGTTIVEPTGISPRNVSTPSDLITIGKLAAANPALAKIVATPGLSLAGPGPMNSTNALLGSEGITGLKTGNLGPGNYTMLYSARLDVGTAQPLTVIGVVLGGSSRESVNAGILTTLSQLREGFHQVPLAERGDPLGSYRTPWGSKVRLVVGDDASIFTWSDTPVTVSMTTTTPVAYEDGEVVGSLTWTAGPNTTTVDIELEGSISPPTAWWRLTHPLELVGE